MHLCSMKVSVDVIYFLIVVAALSILVFLAYKISSKKIEKENTIKPYEVSEKKYREFQEMANGVIVNTTITFTSVDTAAVLNVDRGFAGYENIVLKGVALLKKDGFKIPSLGVCDDEK